MHFYPSLVLNNSLINFSEYLLSQLSFMSSSGHRLEACHTQVVKSMLQILFLAVPSLLSYMSLFIYEDQTSEEVLLLS
jgi:hypothetical protein